MADRARLIFWFLLGVAGQACALQLIDAGKLVHYQHWRPLSLHPAFLAAVGVQAALVIAGLVRASRSTPLRSWLGNAWLGNTSLAATPLVPTPPVTEPRALASGPGPGRARLIAAAAFCVLASAFVSRDPAAYAAEALFASFVQAVSLGNALLVAMAAGNARRDEWLESPRFVPLAALWVTLAAAVLSLFSYQRHPHVSDEVSYVYQARYFASGLLTMPAPPAPDAFNLDLMTFEKDRWYSPFPPGWPAALALGVWLGVPWMVNPLLAGLSVLLAGRFLESVYSRAVARWSVLLLAVSPWFLFLAMSYMAHIFSLACALGASLGAVRRRPLWSGAALGLLYLTRPLEAMVLGPMIGLWMLGWGGGVRAAALLTAGFSAGAAAHFAYNRHLTGSATYFPVMAYFDKYYGVNSNAMGFGPERGVHWPIDPFPGHSPLDAMVNAALNTAGINVELFGWGSGSLLALAIFVCAGRLSRADRVMLGFIAGVFTAQFFYWFSGGPDFGARYWFLIIIPCVALTARGLEFLAARAGPQVRATALALSAMALLTFVPWRAVDKYHHYLRMRPDVLTLAEDQRFGRSLVFVKGERFPDYASAAIYNPLDLKADAPIYVWDRGPRVHAQALEAYPDRPVWVLEGPTLTGSGFRVLSGPVR